MKRALFAILQFVLFLLVFAIGSFLPPFHIARVLSVTPNGTRIFIWDGVVLMVAVLALILLIETFTRRIRTAGSWTAVAFVLATIAGLAAKLGFLTTER